MVFGVHVEQYRRRKWGYEKKQFPVKFCEHRKKDMHMMKLKCLQIFFQGKKNFHCRASFFLLVPTLRFVFLARKKIFKLNTVAGAGEFVLERGTVCKGL